MTTRILGAGVRGAMILAATGMILTAGAPPVAVDWKATETALNPASQMVASTPLRTLTNRFNAACCGFLKAGHRIRKM